MKYIGIYWSLFAPMMKKSIRKRFGESLAEISIREGKKEYRRLLSRADDLGPGNPMASNAYFAYVFAAAWLGSGRKIRPEDSSVTAERSVSMVPCNVYFCFNDSPHLRQSVLHNGSVSTAKDRSMNRLSPVFLLTIRKDPEGNPDLRNNLP